MVASAGFLVTCEHASRTLPLSYRSLGLTRAQLSSHIAWDPGAAVAARALAARLDCPLHLGRYSRLLIDLNRSERHPKLIARNAFGVDIPGNWDVSASERVFRLERYWLPYRRAVIEEISRILHRRSRLIHWSMHSFTPLLHGVKRNADVGLLYDPANDSEVRLADAAAVRLQDAGFRVRRNYPYRGTSDGLITHCRTVFAPDSYAGIEVEINQALLGTPSQTRRIGSLLSSALAPAV